MGYEELGASTRGEIASHFEARRKAEAAGVGRADDAMGVDEEGDITMGVSPPPTTPEADAPAVVLPTHLPARPGRGLFADGAEEEEDAGLDDEVEGNRMVTSRAWNGGTA